MGVGVSGWELAQAVSRCGQMGVVSGTALDSLLVRRLQDGDKGGHIRRAAGRFPIPGVAETVLRRYFQPGGKEAHEPYKLLPMYRQVVSVARQQLTMLASFAEVHLAKEGHRGLIGINFLTKLQLPNLASLYGAMLAGVDVVLMGAGIPREIPGALDRLATHGEAEIRFDVEGLGPGEAEFLKFDPVAHGADTGTQLERPRFFAIVAASSLATTLARKANGRVDGFVIEGHTAGGHNAPPRGPLRLTPAGEPEYGDRDIVDLERIREIGLPFWIAGGAGSPEQLRRALAQGATGIQVGTLFAYSDESGFSAEIKREVLERARRGELGVMTDPRASPTGYPFKIVRWHGDAIDRSQRERNCDLGYLRTAYRRPDGRIGYRCPAEPVEDYVAKGGAESDTVGRQCICNGLVAAIGHAQVRGDGFEAPIITSGDDLLNIASFLGDRMKYTAADVVDYLLDGVDLHAGM
jgi:NAD(P)H-dependent flavin oxidoreductase YrpB (nitropropane dioxygenase family)